MKLLRHDFCSSYFTLLNQDFLGRMRGEEEQAKFRKKPLRKNMCLGLSAYGRQKSTGKRIGRGVWKGKDNLWGQLLLLFLLYQHQEAGSDRSNPLVHSGHGLRPVRFLELFLSASLLCPGQGGQRGSAATSAYLVSQAAGNESNEQHVEGRLTRSHYFPNHTVESDYQSASQFSHSFLPLSYFSLILHPPPRLLSPSLHAP